MSVCLNEFKISCIASHKHYNSIIMHLDVCKLIVCWKDWIGLSPWYNFFCMSHVHAFPMHTYSIFNVLAIFEMCWDFSDCLSFSLSFLFTLVVSMAPKRKSTPSQNPLRSGASSSSDPTPSSIRFHDEDARKDFSENFPQRGVHLECRVTLANFADTDLPNVIHCQGWESLCDVPITCPSILIQEFYFNMHGLDSLVPLFHTHVWGTRIVVDDASLISRLNYLRCYRLKGCR